MDNDFAARAEARRKTWTGKVAHSWDEHEQQGVEFWMNASPSDKLSAMWQALTEAWMMEGKNGSAPRFQGSLVSVGRFER